jgi:hypothetical protein
VTETGYLGAASPARTTSFTYAPDSSALSAWNGFMTGLPQNSASTLHTMHWEDKCHVPASPSGCVEQIGDDTYPVFGDYKGNIEVADIDNDGIAEYIQGPGEPDGMDCPRPHETISPAVMGSTRVWRVNANLNGWVEDTVLQVPALFRRWDEARDASENFGARFLDLDRDGTQDLVVSYKFQPPEAGEVVHSPVEGQFAWFNNGQQKGVDWSGRTPFALPNGMFLSYYGQDPGVRIADVNGDGYPDLIQAYEPSGQAVSGYPDARGLPPNVGCFSSVKRKEPPTGQGVYLMDPVTRRWTAPDSTYVVPANVYFVGLAPVDPYRWRVSD